MAIKILNLDGAVEEGFEALPPTARTISKEQAVGMTLDMLATLAEQHPEEVKEALARFAMANPDIYQNAVPDMFDGQTGLMAKDYFENAVIPDYMEKARSEGRQLCLLKIDIDDFKKFNSTYGWKRGDQVIDYVVDNIKQSVRLNRDLGGEPDAAGIFRDEYHIDEKPQFVYSRTGNGEEFGIILYNTTLEDGYQVAERLRQAVADHHLQTERGELSVTVSVGVVGLESGMTPQDLMEKADENLQTAKDAGKNRVYADGYLARPAADVPPPNQQETKQVA